MSEPRNVVTKISEGGAIGAGRAVMAGTATKQVKVPTGANVVCQGITGLAAAGAAEAIPVIIGGPARAVLGFACNRHDYLMAYDTAGGLGPIGASSGAIYHVVAIAEEAGAATDEIEVFVIRSLAQAA